MEDPRRDALINVTITSVVNSSNQKFSNSLLNAYITKPDLQRLSILTKKCDLSGQKCSVGEEALALCASNDYFQLQLVEDEKLAAYMKFPLQQLLEMPRVAHEIECKLLKAQKWDSMDRSPLRHIAQVDLTITPFNKDLGKFVISGVQIELTRNTELIGQMDPYVQFLLQGEMKKTEVRDNQGMHSIWNQRIQFRLKDINKSFLLTARVLDKDNISSDLVGTANIDLITQRMLLANEEITSRTFTLLYGAQSAGKIKLEFQFIPKQFNF